MLSLQFALRAEGATHFLAPRETVGGLVGGPFRSPDIRFAKERGWLRREEIRGFHRCLRDATIFSLWFSVKFPALRHAYLLTN